LLARVVPDVLADLGDADDREGGGSGATLAADQRSA
jgi:hypothetical protein